MLHDLLEEKERSFHPLWERPVEKNEIGNSVC